MFQYCTFVHQIGLYKTGIQHFIYCYFVMYYYNIYFIIIFNIHQYRIGNLK